VPIGRTSRSAPLTLHRRGGRHRLHGLPRNDTRTVARRPSLRCAFPAPDRLVLPDPHLEHLGHYPRLGSDRNVLSFAPLRIAIAEQIEQVHREALRQHRSDLAPTEGLAGCAVNEHYRPASADPIPRYAAAARLSCLRSRQRNTARSSP